MPIIASTADTADIVKHIGDTYDTDVSTWHSGRQHGARKPIPNPETNVITIPPSIKHVESLGAALLVFSSIDFVITPIDFIFPKPLQYQV